MMNNKDFISELARRSGSTLEHTQKKVNALLQVMGTALQGGECISANGFGVFEVKKRLERVVINPATRQRMLVPPKLILNFKPSTTMKEIINRGGQQDD